MNSDDDTGPDEQPPQINGGGLPVAVPPFHRSQDGNGSDSDALNRADTARQAAQEQSNAMDGRGESWLAPGKFDGAKAHLEELGQVIQFSTYAGRLEALGCIPEEIFREEVDNRVEAQHFLELLDPNADFFTFQTFDDDADRDDRNLVRIIHGSLDECWGRLVRLNGKGAGIFVTINETDGKGRKEENIKRVRALFLDLDGAPLKPVMDDVNKPDVVVESSPGRYHAYYFTDEVGLEKFEGLQKKLATRFKGDNVSDLPRVLRMPGFLHQKNKPFLTRIIYVNPDPAEGSSDPFLDYSDYIDEMKGPTDVEGLYAAMVWYGSGVHGGNAHRTLVRCSSALLRRGNPIDEVVARGLKELAAAAARSGGKMNWGVEEKKLWRMCKWLKEHPLPNAENVEDAKVPPKLVLKLADWTERDLPDPDFLLGDLFSTTSRILLAADTGLGKTLFSIAAGMRASEGCGFLGWQGRRASCILYIDGEMSRRWLKRCLIEEAARLGKMPETFFALNTEDIPGLQPLNTRAGQKMIEDIAREHCGGVDLIIFDNIMALIAGNHSEEEGWTQTLPWVRDLTRRAIGQVWVHHTGHNTTRQYGTKTREWQMTTYAQLDKVERKDTDVSFQLSFKKARERTRNNRDQFSDVKIALVDNNWRCDGVDRGRKDKLSPEGQKYLNCLAEAIEATRQEAGPLVLSPFPAAAVEDWRKMCLAHGLLDPHAPPNSIRALFSKYKRELIVKNWIECNETMAWMI
jgi:hypothetical protein